MNEYEKNKIDESQRIRNETKYEAKIMVTMAIVLLVISSVVFFVRFKECRKAEFSIFYCLK